MRIVERDTGGATLYADYRDLARLAKLLDWIVTERPVMDPADIMLEPEEVESALRRWLDFLDREALSP